MPVREGGRGAQQDGKLKVEGGGGGKGRSFHKFQFFWRRRKKKGEVNLVCVNIVFVGRGEEKKHL